MMLEIRFQTKLYNDWRKQQRSTQSKRCSSPAVAHFFGINLPFKQKQGELSRATLKFSFHSPNNISGQNILVRVQKFVWSNQILGQRKLGSKKSLVPKIWSGEIVGPISFWVQTILGPNKVWSQNYDTDEIVGPTFFLVQIILGPNKFWVRTNLGRKKCWS